MRLLEIGSTSIKLELRLTDIPSGAITGQTVTVAIRRKSDQYYLDFADNTFKNSGWTTRTQTCTELTGNEKSGVYAYTFDSSTAITDHGEYAADFAWNDGVTTWYESEDLRFGKLTLAEKTLTHKLAIDEGTSTLKIYEVDGSTVAESWPLTDKDGAAISLTGTAPANRGNPT